MNENSHKPNVTLEDLLRVKRAEQPPAEFWAEFERGMRTKQLAAIIEPRPWWAPFIKISTRMSRYQVPVGAAAILAITFLTVREYRTVELAPVYEPVASSINVAAPAAVSETPSRLAPVSVTSSAPQAVVAEETAAVPASSSSAAPRVSTADLVGTSSHVAPAPAKLTPSARYIAENLAAAQAADPELDQMLGRTIHNFDNHSARTEPLAQVSVPGESRRSRLLAGNALMASASLGDSTLRTDERSSRRLSERRLAESDAVSHIEVSGDRFSMKF